MEKKEQAIKDKADHYLEEQTVEAEFDRKMNTKIALLQSNEERKDDQLENLEDSLSKAIEQQRVEVGKREAELASAKNQSSKSNSVVATAPGAGAAQSALSAGSPTKEKSSTGESFSLA
mmetsp:Transcript_7220/g.11350  ORF Transcript_7220/g.11350 Transcript_7220/m.11350 type:complete len:119 (+) Transcript_7220:592-948(+)